MAFIRLLGAMCRWIRRQAAAPNAPKLYIDYLCTADAQKIIAESGDFPIAPGSYPNLKDAEKLLARAVFMESPSEAQFSKLKKEFRKIFLTQ
jgi:ABC-type Fe3+ transport system substrate-binding protein